MPQFMYTIYTLIHPILSQKSIMKLSLKKLKKVMIAQMSTIEKLFINRFRSMEKNDVYFQKFDIIMKSAQIKAI